MSITRLSLFFLLSPWCLLQSQNATNTFDDFTIKDCVETPCQDIIVEGGVGGLSFKYIDCNCNTTGVYIPQGKVYVLKALVGKIEVAQGAFNPTGVISQPVSNTQYESALQNILEEALLQQLSSIDNFIDINDQNICTGDQPTQIMGREGQFFDFDVSYSWLKSIDNINYSHISGAREKDYTPEVLSQTTYFKRQVYTAVSTGTYSDEVMIAVSDCNTNCTLPTVSFTSGLINNVLCEGDTVTFDASGTTGAANYEFFVGGLSQGAPSAVSTFTPSIALNDQVTVTVRAYSSNFSSCQADQSIVIRVNGFSGANTITGSQTLCSGDNPNTILSSATPTANLAAELGATLSYQWQSRTGANSFVDIPGATILIYDPSPLVTTTAFRRIVMTTFRGASCPSNIASASSNIVTITVDPSENCLQCSITSSVTAGSLSQTVTQSTSLATTTIDFAYTCDDALIIEATGLPPGITTLINDNIITLYGEPSDQASGVYSFSVIASSTLDLTTNTVTGTIEVLERPNVPTQIRPHLLSSVFLSPLIEDNVGETFIGPFNEVTTPTLKEGQKYYNIKHQQDEEN